MSIKLIKSSGCLKKWQDIVVGKTLLKGVATNFPTLRDEKRFLTKLTKLIKLDTAREKIISLIKFNYSLRFLLRRTIRWTVKGFPGNVSALPRTWNGKAFRRIRVNMPSNAAGCAGQNVSDCGELIKGVNAHLNNLPVA